MNYLAARAEMAVRDVRWGAGPGGLRLEKSFYSVYLDKIKEAKTQESSVKRESLKRYLC